MIQLVVGGSNVTLASPKEGLTVQWNRKGSPGKIDFEMPKAGASVSPGAPVFLSKNGRPAFGGYVFRVEESADDFLKVTAYDQIRYLTKNKDTIHYKNKSADQLIRMLAADFNLNVGSLSSTGYIIPKRIEDNTTLYDMIQHALDETMMHTKELFILYDDAGALTLKHLSEMYCGVLALESNSDQYTFTRSIDGNTYNKIKLARENKEKGKREIFIAQDSNNMARWGILQYFEKINIDDKQAKQKANALLSLHNNEERSFRIRNIAGDFAVRGGSLLSVDIAGISGQFMAEEVTHRLENNLHTMDIKLRGGTINA